jgi:tetratricopeptide (TPR) repeat protein
MRQLAVVAVALAATSVLITPAPTFGQDVPEFSADALAAYAAGAKHYRAGQYQEAILQYAKAYELDRNFVVALFQAALCHSNLGNISTRDSLLAIVEEAKERLSEYYRHRLETQLASAAGNPDGALEAARRAAEVGPGTKGVYQVSYWALRRNRPREARDVLLSLDPYREPMKGWTAYWTQLVWAHHLLGEHDAELAAARRAREQYPDQFFGLVIEAQALAALGQMEELERVIAESMSATPSGAANTPGALMTTAAAELAAHGHVGAAEDLYSRAAAWYDEQPEDQVASVAQRNWRTFTLIGAGRWEDAKPVCESLLEDAPDEGWFHTMGGYVAARLGDTERATSQLRWLEGHEDTKAYQGTLHAVLGDKARALELLAEDFEAGAYATLWWHRDVLLFPLLGDDPAYAEIMRPKG